MATDRIISEPITYFGADGRMKLEVRSESLTCDGATEVTSGLIPAGCFLLGVSTRVTTAVTDAGANTYDVGIGGGDTDLWGAGIAGTLGTTSDMSDFTDAAASGIYTAATEVTLTPDTADFATGVVLVVAYFLQAVP